LMGDPTLRNDMVAPVSNLKAEYLEPHAFIQWSPSQDSVLGYHIYRKTTGQDVFEKLNSAPLTAHFFADSCLSVKGTYTYMVRAVKLENTNGGSYYNLSTGITISFDNPNEPVQPAEAAFSLTQNGYSVTLENKSQNATNFEWDFGDNTKSDTRNAEHTYATSGKYMITLVARNDCYSDTFRLEVTISVSAVEDGKLEGIVVYPNPAQHEVYIKLPEGIRLPVVCRLLNAMGQLVFETKLDDNTVKLDLRNLPDGVYILASDNGLKSIKLVVSRL
jgi:hypothetical protein